MPTVAGTYEVTDFKRAFGSNVLQAASSSTAITADEVENTWKHVQKISAVGTTEAGDFGGHALGPDVNFKLV